MENLKKSSRKDLVDFRLPHNTTEWYLQANGCTRFMGEETVEFSDVADKSNLFNGLYWDSQNAFDTVSFTKGYKENKQPYDKKRSAGKYK